MLILTMLTSRNGYSEQAYRRFAGSLFDTGFDGDIVFFTTADEIHDSNLLLLQDEYSGLRFSIVPAPADDRDVNCYRYRNFRYHLKYLPVEYDYVMLTDSRDLIFQRDISKFPYPEDADLFFAEEEKLIGDCGINAGWIHELYGADCLARLSDKPVLCSGTTIGKSTAMLDYLEFMLQQIDRFDKPQREKVGFLGGIDQGIHNFLYYTEVLADLNIKTMHNRDNMVYTIGHVASDSRDRDFLDADSRFINQNGDLCYCVHQYDRLDRRVIEKFNRNSRFSI